MYKESVTGNPNGVGRVPDGGSVLRAPTAAILLPSPAPFVLDGKLSLLPTPRPLLVPKPPPGEHLESEEDTEYMSPSSLPLVLLGSAGQKPETKLPLETTPSSW